MESLSPQCTICVDNYDIHTNIPKILPLCGHTVCVECLKQLLQMTRPKCPFDNIGFPPNSHTIESFPTNFALKDLIEENLDPENLKICQIHKERKKLACLTDKCTVCAYCVLYGEHKDHVVKPIADMKSEVDSKGKKLEDLVNKIDSYYKSLDITLTQQEISALGLVEDNFTKLIALLQEKKMR